MRKNVWTFGMIAGLILAVWLMAGIAWCYTTGNFNGSMILGYASMILAFSLVFAGVKNHRDKFNNGIISFGKAFKIGLYIALIASAMYVLVWLVDYYVFIPDFMDKYSAHVIKEIKTSGATPNEMAAKTKEINSMKEMYKNPLLVVLLTFLEVFPIGLVVSIITALILKRKNKGNITAATD